MLGAGLDAMAACKLLWAAETGLIRIAAPCEDSGMSLEVSEKSSGLLAN